MPTTSSPPTRAHALEWRPYVGLVKQAGAAWIQDRAPTMGAALAFYTALALAPLLIIIVALAGTLFGIDAVQRAIVGQLTTLAGARFAEAVRILISTPAQPATTAVLPTVIGVLTMLVGATSVLVELQDDLDHIWRAPPRPGNGLLSIVKSRVLSLGMLLAIGFMLLVSLVLTAGMAGIGAFSEDYFPRTALVLLHIANAVFSLACVTAVFAMLFKWLPNASIGWRDVGIGAFTTAVLFSGGRIAIGLYLGESAIASAYGAAGTLVVLLLWLYYSAQVFLFGAELTHVHAAHRLSVSEGGTGPGIRVPDR